MTSVQAYSNTEFRNAPYTAYYQPAERWNGRDRILLDSLFYTVFVDGKFYNIEVPCGFVSDLGSIPKKLRGIVDDNDQSILGFILHDYLFKADCPFQFERHVTDLILKSCILDDGHSWYHATKTWLGVFIGRVPVIGAEYHVDNVVIDTEYADRIIDRIYSNKQHRNLIKGQK